MSNGTINDAEGLQSGLRIAAVASLGREIEQQFETYYAEVTENLEEQKSLNAIDALRRGIRRSLRAYKAANAMIKEEFKSNEHL